MAKRSATKELNHDNWDDEEEAENPSQFVPLQASELKHRIIKKAKRSLTNVANTTQGGSSPFSAFSGFSTQQQQQKRFCIPDEKRDKNGKEDGSGRNIEYYHHLQSLNESVISWMQLHLSKNPCCDFTPVFKDYTKHLDTLNLTYPVKLKPPEQPSSSEPTANNVHDQLSSDSTPHKGDSTQKGETDYGANFTSNTTNTSTFSFGCKRTPTATSSLSSGFPNSSEKPFTFMSEKSTTGASAESSEQNSDEPEYVPPKNDFVAVKEEDAFYSRRCKLFFKKDEGYTEKGVGILYLKPLENKTQLLIRADTSLGNILLNIVLSDSLPTSRTGKNNVLIVCVPNPPMKEVADGGAIPMLIRVKTAEDADELLETLNKHKS